MLLEIQWGLTFTDAAAWNLQARLLSEKGEMPEAIYGFEKAIRLRPREGSNLCDYALLNRLDEAFQPALEAAAILEKMDAASRAEAVAIGMRTGLILL